MPKLPDPATVLGDRPTPRSQRTIATYRGGIAEAAEAEVGQGIADLGRGVSKAAIIFQNDYQQQEDFETERKFLQWSSDRDVKFTEEKSKVQPGAPRFAQTYTQDYDKASGEFMGEVPDRLKPKYQNKVTALRGRYAENGTVFELTERQRYYGEKTDEMTGTLAGAVKADPDSYDARLQQADEFINTSGLIPRAKEAGRTKAKETLLQARIEGLVLNGRDDEARALAQRADEDRQLAASTPADIRGVIDEAAGATGVPASYLYRTAKRESNFDPNAQSRTSSGGGLFQFVDKTWSRMLEKHGEKYGLGPDTPKTDPRANALMAAEFTKENGKVLSEAGLPVNDKTLYIAHFAGAQGAVKLLQADPGASAAELLPAAAKANKSIFYNGTQAKTVRDVVSSLALPAGGDAKPVRVASADGTVGVSTDAPQRPQATGAFSLSTESLIAKRNTETQKAETKASTARGEEIERVIIDAEAGIGDLPRRELVERDPLLSEAKRNTLLKQYDKAAGDVMKTQRAIQTFAQPNAPKLNPYDKDDRDTADRLFKAYGGDDKALQAVVDRTGIFPKAQASQMRGWLASGDQQKFEFAVTTAATAVARNPEIFAGMEGQKQLETAATTFRHYVDDLGFTPAQASKKMLGERGPEYQQEVRARVKGENIAELQKKHLSVGDLGGAFDDSVLGFGRNPQVGASPRERDGMFNDYAELFRDFYAENGDVGLSKRLAQDQLKRVWGVSNVGGKATVMRYPPERAPGMAGIENASDLIAEDAIASVKAESGKVVPRDKLMILPIEGATASAFKSGRPVPYMLAWVDERGLVQTLNVGRGYVADADAMRRKHTGTRGERFGAARENEAAAREAYNTAAVP